ncbi:MAG: hypothetical protein HQ481_03865 [Alphaproteobacteria bacterium]|nr:hypothetical protein [Alphaproteobacteria bacterium]
MHTDTLSLRIAHWFGITSKPNPLPSIQTPRLPKAPDLDSPAIEAETALLLRDRGWKP